MILLGSNAVAISESVISPVLLTSVCLSVTDIHFTYYKESLCPGNNDVHHVSVDVLNSSDAQVENYVSARSVDCEDEGRHFSVQSETKQYIG
jgi:hypothetical protein